MNSNILLFNTLTGSELETVASGCTEEQTKTNWESFLLNKTSACRFPSKWIIRNNLIKQGLMFLK